MIKTLIYRGVHSREPCDKLGKLHPIPQRIRHSRDFNGKRLQRLKEF